MAPLRIGSVPYLNARPLIEGLEDVTLDVPSRLTHRFRRGELDVALLPSFECVRQPERPVVPGIAIASPGPVDSVLFFSRRPLEEVETLALDESSLTSAALARILCEDHFGVRPEYTSCGPEVDPVRSGADAVLLIGDPALRAERDGLLVTDLASTWRAHTGLPFCFALWIAADEASAKAASGVLRQAKERGLARRAELAAAASEDLGLPAESLLVYLTERITYDLSEGERIALERYGEACRRLALV
jgi:chorismate dehydratase